CYFVFCLSSDWLPRSSSNNWRFSCRRPSRHPGFPKSQSSDHSFHYSHLDRQSRFRGSHREQLFFPSAPTIWHVAYRSRSSSLSRVFARHYGLQWVRHNVCDGLAIWICLLEVAPIMAAHRRPFATDALCTTPSSARGLTNVIGATARCHVGSMLNALGPPCLRTSLNAQYGNR